MILAVAEEKNPENRIGNTPLHLAAEKGYIQIMEMILAVAENKNQENNIGVTALSLAKQYFSNKEGETNDIKLKELDSMFYPILDFVSIARFLTLSYGYSTKS